MIAKYVYVQCDTCTDRYDLGFETVTEARKMAREAGWRIHRDDSVSCPCCVEGNLR